MMVESADIVLIFCGVSRYYTWVFYFKDYNTARQISGRNRQSDRVWWLVTQKTENDTFLEN